MESLSDRLKALGFKPASEIERPSILFSKVDFATILQASEVSNNFGTTYLIEKKYPLDYQHGTINFNMAVELTTISAAAHVQTAQGTNLSNLIFVDTETTGLSGGTGTLAFLVGLGYFTHDGFLLKQFILSDPAEEPSLLLEISKLCSHFLGIVTFNGKGFDIPLLRTRFILNRLPNPFDLMVHFDLLFLSRKIWKNRLQSRALQDLEQEILDIPRTEDEVPGWMIPPIYFDYLRNGDPAPLKGILYHNGMDILSLAALFLHISTSFENIQYSQQFNPIDFFSLGQLYYDLGFTEIAQNIFTECEQQDQLPPHLKLILLRKLGNIFKIQNDFQKALPMWEKAVGFDDISSAIEIAKFFEHIEGDYNSAQFWTETAISLLSKKGYHTYQDRKLEKELNKREGRLSQKLEREHNDV
jgi:uncharacterized protein